MKLFTKTPGLEEVLTLTVNNTRNLLSLFIRIKRTTYFDERLICSLFFLTLTTLTMLLLLCAHTQSHNTMSVCN